MSGQISNIKRQLSSITSTKKLTNAMELVATAKLQKQRRKMESNNNYAYNYHKVLMSAVSSCEIDLSSNRYFIKPKQDKPLYIIVTSNSGLCGSYNMDLLKYVTKTVSKEDKVVAVGNYGIKWLNNNKFNVIREYDRMDDLNPHDINYLITDILESNSQIIAVGNRKDAVEKAYNVKLEENMAFLPGVVSRKKQVVPVLEKCM